VIARARYWEKLRGVPLNERQRLVVRRMLEGVVERGLLVRNAAGGRSTSYSLAAAVWLQLSSDLSRAVSSN
jgi:hypothetical protein